jgi:hypothetical protein
MFSPLELMLLQLAEASEVESAPQSMAQADSMRHFADYTPSALRARPEHKIHSSLATGGQVLESNWPQQLYSEKKNQDYDLDRGVKKAKEKWQHGCLEQACATMEELSKIKKRGSILRSNSATASAA